MLVDSTVSRYRTIEFFDQVIGTNAGDGNGRRK